MSNFFQPIRQFFSRIEPIPAGIYTYQAPPDDPRNYRLHLRVEQDGSGILIVNASTVLHLNHTAAELAYYFVRNKSATEVAALIARRYNVNPEEAYQDYQELTGRILTLIETPDLDPITFLDFDRQVPYSGEIHAPYRLDCALTYRLPEEVDALAAPTKRVSRELSTTEWKTILDKAWQAGIPHVILTGGEPTLRADLAELLQHAENLGQVTGLLTNGLQLAEPAYLDKLLQTGLDHLLIRLNPNQEACWQAIRNAIAEDIFVGVHLTLTPETAAGAEANLQRLAEIGVPAVSLTASTDELEPVLVKARSEAALLDIDLIWDIPVPYSAHNPVSLETSDSAAPEGAGRAWLYVEPDGDVLPAQGVNQVFGNFLTDPWDKIWQS